MIVDGDSDDHIAARIEYHPLYYNETDSDLPPSSDWYTGLSGGFPAPSVAVAQAVLTYGSDAFMESEENNGAIDNSEPMAIVHNNFGGDAFTGADGDDFVADGKITVSNLPSGLTAVATRVSATELNVTVSGTAAAHDNANDVADLTFAFQNAAFTGGNASGVVGSEKSDLVVNFVEVHTVGIGLDFETIQDAIDSASDYDILSLAAQIFTEPDIEVADKSLVVKGQGPGQTIVQANASSNSGCDARVFYIRTSNDSPIFVRLENMTVRHGDISSSQLGGGIYAAEETDLEIRNCEIAENRIDFQGSGFGYGGGLLVEGNSLLIENSTISGNTCDSNGGGICSAIHDDVTIRNCTISGNNSVAGEGGGLYLQGATIENATIACNSSSNGGDGIFFITFSTGCLRLKNTIIANNGAEDINNWNTSEIDMENCIYGTLVNGLGGGDDIGNQQGVDPMLNPLAYNDGGSTATHSLKTGSPAIGAGTSSGLGYSSDQNGKAHVGHPDAGSYEYHGEQGASPDWIGSASSDDISGGPLLEAADGDEPIAQLDLDPGSGGASFTVERFDSSCGPACPANFWWNAEVEGDFVGDLTFFYDETELNGIPEADLRVYHWDSDAGAWEDWGGTVNDVAHSITVENVSDDNFSPFALNVSAPNLIDLVSFEVLYGSDGARLTWETGSEIDNAGFRVWRGDGESGECVRIGDALVPALGDEITGAEYLFEDPSADGTRRFYRLEDVDYDGTSTFHDPTSRSQALSPGWNRLDGAEFAGRSPEDALASIDGNYASVWGLSDDGWRMHAPENPAFGNLESFEPGVYWIDVQKECVLDLP